MRNRVIAIMSEGALYCAGCAGDYDREDVDCGHVVPVTEFDRMVGEGPAQWLDDGCCAGCGDTWGRDADADAKAYKARQAAAEAAEAEARRNHLPSPGCTCYLCMG